jgi:hypothetical protein
LQGLGQRFLAVCGLPADFKRARFQHRAHTRSKSFMVVND